MEVTGYAVDGFGRRNRRRRIRRGELNEDEAQLMACFTSGQRINVTIRALDAAPPRGMGRIVGTKGGHLMGWQEYETVVATATGEQVATREKNSESEGAKFYQNIAAHLKGKESFVITGEWARRPIYLLDLAVQSAKAGRALPAVHG